VFVAPVLVAAFSVDIELLLLEAAFIALLSADAAAVLSVDAGLEQAASESAARAARAT
jgi:hypothetical protein